MKAAYMKLGHFLILLFVFISPVFLQTSDWPQFRGVNCSGIAASNENPPVEFGPDNNLLWKTTLMPGFSSPCISKDRIFLTGLDINNKDLYVYAINKDNGNILWTNTFSVDSLEKVHGVSNQANASPATDGQLVIVYFPSYGLICYDFDGNQKWNVPLPAPVSRFGAGTSPVITGNLILLNLCNDFQNPRLEARNKFDGTIVWSRELVPNLERGPEGYSTPVIYGDECIIYRNIEIASFKLDTGERIWTSATKTTGTSTPVVSNGVVYVGTHTSEGFGDPDKQVNLPVFSDLLGKNDLDRDSLLTETEFPDDLIFQQRSEVTEEFGGFFRIKKAFSIIDTNKDLAMSEKEWKAFNDNLKSYFTKHGLVAIRTGGKGDVSITHQLWKQPEGVAEVPSPLVYKDRVYQIKNGGLVTCVDAMNGEIIYQERLGAPGPYFSSPIIAGENIYTCSRKGVISVFSTEDTFKLLAQTNLGENINATPAVVDHVLYLRTDQTLFAFTNQK